MMATEDKFTSLRGANDNRRLHLTGAELFDTIAYNIGIERGQWPTIPFRLSEGYAVLFAKKVFGTTFEPVASKLRLLGYTGDLTTVGKVVDAFGVNDMSFTTGTHIHGVDVKAMIAETIAGKRGQPTMNEAELAACLKQLAAVVPA